jgi:hypothetical protein
MDFILCLKYIFNYRIIIWDIHTVSLIISNIFDMKSIIITITPTTMYIQAAILKNYLLKYILMGYWFLFSNTTKNTPGIINNRELLANDAAKLNIIPTLTMNIPPKISNI